MSMSDIAAKAGLFRDLHVAGAPLLLPNPWDIGSAKVLEALGFRALATTSAGFANSIGKPDGGVSRSEALGHASEIARATTLPVFADLERCFADEPEGVARTIEFAIDSGIVGCSVEDSTGDPSNPLYDLGLATERVAAAVAVAESAPYPFTITARSENLLAGIGDVSVAIERLQAYESVGAHVVYAPGLGSIDDVSAVVDALDTPVNVLAWPGLEANLLADAGVSRISTGSWLFKSAYAALIRDAEKLLAEGQFVFPSMPSPFKNLDALMAAEQS